MMEGDKAEIKRITYANGTVLTKKKTKSQEDWELDNKSLADIKFTMDLSKCKNVQFSKEKDREKTIKSVKVPCGKKKKLFTLNKTPPYEMDPKFTKKETPISLEKQREVMRPEIDRIESECKKIEEEVMKMPFEVMEVDQIRKKVKSKGFSNFIDAHFPPNDISIYNPLKVEYPYKKIVHWRRPKDFMKSTPMMFHDDIHPNDIKQGFLGNCWFLWAVASLAERPALVRRLFITKEYNEEGIYRLKICKNGEWVTVTVDDYIPCYYNAGPMFAHSIGDELWVLLLEKAYAKLHGNYYALKSGFSYHAMIDLSGCPTEHIKFPKNHDDFEDEEVQEKAEEIYETLLNADDRGYLITASTPGKDKLTTGEGKKPKSGLVPGHAYSIIKVKQHEDICLVNFRNPWGKFEWDGAWSDKSDMWTEEMIEIFEPVLDENDGSFWMWLQDFFIKFKSVTLWDIENWNEVRVRGKFIKVLDKHDLSQDRVISKFYYSFDIDEDDTNVVIGIHQEDKRSLGAHLRGYLDVCYIILKRNDDDKSQLEYYDHADFSKDREFFKSVCFEEGSYVIVPFTSGALLQRLHPGGDKKFNLKKATSEIIGAKEYFHSTIDDVFRKIDLTANGILSAKELNQFGNIVNSDEFKNIKQKDFKSSKFENISCTKDGFTKYGFYQFLYENFNHSQIEKILAKLGYDSQLHSTKSRVFVITFQADESLKIKIHDILDGDMNKTACNIFMDSLCSNKDNEDLEIDTESHEDIEIYKYLAKSTKCYLFGAINNSDEK